MEDSEKVRKQEEEKNQLIKKYSMIIEQKNNQLEKFQERINELLTQFKILKEKYASRNK